MQSTIISMEFDDFTADEEKCAEFPVEYKPSKEEQPLWDLARRLQSAERFEPKPGQFQMTAFRRRHLGQSSPTFVNADSGDEDAEPVIVRKITAQFHTGPICSLDLFPGSTVEDVLAQLRDCSPAEPSCSPNPTTYTLIFAENRSDKSEEKWKIVPGDIDLFLMFQYWEFVVYVNDAPLPDQVSDLSYEIQFRLDDMGFRNWLRSLPVPASACVIPLSCATFADADAFLKTRGSSIEEFMSVYRV